MSGIYWKPPNSKPLPPIRNKVWNAVLRWFQPLSNQKPSRKDVLMEARSVFPTVSAYKRPTRTTPTRQIRSSPGPAPSSGHVKATFFQRFALNLRFNVSAKGLADLRHRKRIPAISTGYLPTPGDYNTNSINPVLTHIRISAVFFSLTSFQIWFMITGKPQEASQVN